MQEKEISELIYKLEKVKNLKTDAYVGMFYEGNDHFRVIANKEGIIKLVIELFESLKDFDFHLSKEDHFSLIPFNTKEQWFDKSSDFGIDYIEPINEVRSEILKIKSKNNYPIWKSRIIGILLILVVVFVAFIAILGFIEFLFWII